jgi:hypothetical protein
MGIAGRMIRVVHTPNNGPYVIMKDRCTKEGTPILRDHVQNGARRPHQAYERRHAYAWRVTATSTFGGAARAFSLARHTATFSPLRMESTARMAL